MLVMKGWLETRWRLAGNTAFPLIWLAIHLAKGGPANMRLMLDSLGMLLILAAMQLAGSGVPSQSPIGFPEGLVGSTQFTITLPVSRLKLLSVRTVIGMLETMGLTVFVGVLTYGLFPSLRTIVTPTDFAKLVVTILLFLPFPYFLHAFFTTFVQEPLSGMYAGWTLVLMLWGLHHAPGPMDIIRSWGPASPLMVHTLPWPQLAISLGLATFFFWATLQVVQTREY